jgi:Zn-dependent protease
VSADWLLERVVTFVPVLLSLTVHEWAHAVSAWRLGDDTAERLGRMTLNPIAHVDPFGTLLLPLLGVPFGWAKPVPVNPLRFGRGVSMAGGMALVAAAGPLSNCVLAALAVALCALGARLDPAGFADGTAFQLLSSFALVNAALAAFNLIPLPPLDGSRIVDALITERLRPAWTALESSAPLLLGALLVLPMLTGVSPIGWLLRPFWELLHALVTKGA